MPQAGENGAGVERRFARQVAAVYALAGVLWIGLSDRLLESWIDDPAALTRWQTLKGWLYILATTLLLYAILRHRLRPLAQTQADLRQRASDLEERVAQRTAELREASAELEAYASGLSHDLRAPLRAVQGFASALIEDCGPRLDPQGLDYARRITGAARRMDEMIRALLAYSRLGHDPLPISPIDLASAIDGALARLQGAIRERGADVMVERPLPSVLGHLETLTQMTASLVSNALTFVAPGARPRVRLRAERRGERVRLWVEDNGIGIAPEHQQRIFNLFERLHGPEAYPGAGFGLAMVRRSAARLGGVAGVESAAGQGSRFWLDVPAPQGSP